MQLITLGSTAQNLCDNLAAVAVPTFFDSVEMSSGSTTDVECKKNGVVVLKIQYQGVLYCEFYGNGVSFLRQTSSYDYINLLIATNKAIYLSNAYGNGAFIVISKDTDGDVSMVACISSNAISAVGSSAGNFPVTIYAANGNNTRYYYLNNDNTNKKSYFIPLYINDGLFVDGVYIALVRPYPNEPGYMPFTIGSAQYVGFSASTFIVQDS